MTRYQELCALAAQHSRQFHEDKQACTQTAEKLIQAYAEYLECPMDQIVQIRLGSKLERTSETAIINAVLPLVIDQEGFWRFCWRINFDSGSNPFTAHEFVAIGLKIDGSLLTIREDKDFHAGVDNNASWGPFLTHLFSQSKAGFAKPYGQFVSRIGFLPQ